MKRSLRIALLLSGVAPLPALAHVDYTGQDFGTFTGSTTASSTLANRTVDGHYGWADAADADWGDSHKGRFLSFTLENAASVTVSVQSNTLTPNPQGGVLLPGFSLYEGLAAYLAHDYSEPAFAWRDAQPTPENPLAATEGYWNALGSFQTANDAGETSFLTFIGYAVDGTFANFGHASTFPGIVSDGVADGFVSQTFSLDAGTYSLVVGGATYAGAGTSAGNRAYGFSATLDVAPVPEPETWAMLLAGLGLVGTIARRRSSADRN
ncbi:FxDxF family PEP-CTERM protein [Nitrosovibrio sp. Nv17]|uniref:FxDxF family PEP-CTERM protein n=1 Tax=Nitrosovibrio sp. Nv17 TaxID=1855339 RepID=UPI000908B059|nr:FxDxF family PEP-CTERM protein [Nitrosovibrio sp. Nv17]SFW16217.1 PEP-CTERM protein-sorting domain-containing protein/MYXO-CTERM domain-containing protein [Nitrosovibrio sp. Nv17]